MGRLGSSHAGFQSVVNWLQSFQVAARSVNVGGMASGRGQLVDVGCLGVMQALCRADSLQCCPGCWWPGEGAGGLSGSCVQVVCMWGLVAWWVSSSGGQLAGACVLLGFCAGCGRGAVKQWFSLLSRAVGYLSIPVL